MRRTQQLFGMWLALALVACGGGGGGSSSGGIPGGTGGTGGGSGGGGTTPSLVVEARETISTRGSNRATAYAMSNKIVSAGDFCFAAWLDAPSEIMVRTLDRRTGAWGPATKIGSGTDNHGGPALAIDPAGHLHAIYGPHHGPFQHSRSTRPLDASSWAHMGTFGTAGTYPSVVVGARGTLHVTYRGGASPRRLIYQRLPVGGSWTRPVELVDPTPDTGYTQYGNALAMDAGGTLHLGFHLLTNPNGNTGKAIGYLRSRDGGVSWESADGQVMRLPVTAQSAAAFIEQDRSANMRVGGLAVDAGGRPWMLAQRDVRMSSSQRALTLWHHDGAAWQARDLLPEIQAHWPAWGPAWGQPGTLTFDGAGRLYIALGIQIDPGGWGDPSTEVAMLVSADGASTFSAFAISGLDPAVPAWLTSIERPTGPGVVGTPSLLYTVGGPVAEPTRVEHVRFGWR
jgi:hypothetical protein